MSWTGLKRSDLNCERSHCGLTEELTYVNCRLTSQLRIDHGGSARKLSTHCHMSLLALHMLQKARIICARLANLRKACAAEADETATAAERVGQTLAELREQSNWMTRNRHWPACKYN
jgi:hypothetical protein